jgi:pimeloyl-ACP methyl ester carboxylesterase
MTGFVDRTWTSPDGLELYARDHAAGPGPARLPVICLQGLTRTARDFEDVAPWIPARGRRVRAAHLRGRGRSAWDPRPMRYVPLTYARDVLALMQQAGIARAVFVGTSMGGLITMTLAQLRSPVVAAAVLNDVGPVLSPAGLARIAGYTGKTAEPTSWAEAAAYARSTNAHAFPEMGDAEWLAFARRLFREQDGRIRLDYDPDITVPFGKIKPVRPAVMWALFRHLARKRPTLLVRGQTSDLLAQETAARMRSLAPKMAYAEVPGVGHAPMLTEPAARGALEAFLRDAP